VLAIVNSRNEDDDDDDDDGDPATKGQRETVRRRQNNARERLLSLVVGVYSLCINQSH